jgi:hypothetical protein
MGRRAARSEKLLAFGGEKGDLVMSSEEKSEAYQAFGVLNQIAAGGRISQLGSPSPSGTRTA